MYKSSALHKTSRYSAVKSTQGLVLRNFKTLLNAPNTASVLVLTGLNTYNIRDIMANAPMFHKIPHFLTGCYSYIKSTFPTAKTLCLSTKLKDIVSRWLTLCKKMLYKYISGAIILGVIAVCCVIVVVCSVFVSACSVINGMFLAVTVGGRLTPLPRAGYHDISHTHNKKIQRSSYVGLQK